MYRVWLEEVLGFKLRGSRLSIEPAIPDDWPGYSIVFRYGQTDYRIEVENGGEATDHEIQLEDDRQPHTIRIRVGRPRKPGVKTAESAPATWVEATSRKPSDGVVL
jgi:cellobiose phosphorylase